MTNQELRNTIDELKALPKENEWVEFKSGNATTHDKLGQYISALSNGACISNQPFGYLIFGIDDVSHAVVGTNFRFKNAKEGNEELELWIRRLLYPSIRFQHFEFEYDACHMELFIIPAAKSEPTHFKKVPYIRFDSSVTDLRNYPQYVRAIYNSEEDWSANVVENASIKDLDPLAIARAKEKFKEKKKGTVVYDEIEQWDNEVFLDKTKITVGGKITNTAILLLGKPESVHLISPAVAQITWKLDTEEKAYEHFETPFFLTINDVLNRIRNVKYKFFPNNQLVSVEVNKYESKVILEALNNCIAHQDYSEHARILVTEQSNKLIFRNAGGFIEGSPEDYTLGEKTPERYRNRWLANAMVNLNMIDTLGYGIHRMYEEQRKRYFPLPDYSKSTRNGVVLEIYGHTIDENYSKLLIEKKDDLSLTEVILLDKIQKGQPITDDAAKLLKKKNLIEGRKPHYHISSSIASATDMKAEYIKLKGIEDEYCKKLIKDYILKFNGGKRADFESLLDDKLPELLTRKQKKDKVKNLLQSMKRDGTIILNGITWRLK